MISSAVRKLGLTTHVGSSVGWFGSVLTFLGLAIYGAAGGNLQTVRAVYVSMSLIGWWIIVPLSFAALVTGIFQSLISPWGLFRHYWVMIKLMITVVATALLLLHMQPVGHLARVVAARTLEDGELAGLRLQLVADAGAALVALLIALILSVYKPQGLTPYGRRKKRENLRRGTVSAPNQIG